MKYGIGCWVGTQYYGILVYADDMMLLSPSITGLQTILNTCSQFAKEYGLQFNAKKTMCIEFHGRNKGGCKVTHMM